MPPRRVDLKHLLEDRRDARRASLEESLVTEIVWRALDADAARIRLCVDAAAARLAVIDDGRGLTRQAFTRLNRVAPLPGRASGAMRPDLALGLLVADELVLESRRGARHLATAWQLETRYRAPWTWIEPPRLVEAEGTAVRLHLSNPLSPLLDTGYLEEVIRTRFATLLDPVFEPLLGRQWPAGVRFEINGERLLPASNGIRARVILPVRLGRRRIPSAIAMLQQHEHPVPEDQQGFAVSAFGRVIRRGWGWLGLAPTSAWRVTGVVEAPELAGCLTPDGSDFMRSGSAAAIFGAHRTAIAEAVTRQLAAWGDVLESEPRPRPARLDRELEAVLDALSASYPRLRSLAQTTAGGQTPLPLSDRTADDGGGSSAAPARRDLLVHCEPRPGDPDVGRVENGAIWINDAHPAYLRASESRALGYHTALTIALALAPLAAAAEERTFVTRFLAQWGEGRGKRRSP